MGVSLFYRKTNKKKGKRKGIRRGVVERRRGKREKRERGDSGEGGKGGSLNAHQTYEKFHRDKVHPHIKIHWERREDGRKDGVRQTNST